MKKANYEFNHKRLIEHLQLKAPLTSLKVLKAISMVPRHLFVLEKFQELSYDDIALPIGYTKQYPNHPYSLLYYKN